MGSEKYIRAAGCGHLHLDGGYGYGCGSDDGGEESGSGSESCDREGWRVGMLG